MNETSPTIFNARIAAHAFFASSAVDPGARSVMRPRRQSCQPAAAGKMSQGAFPQPGEPPRMRRGRGLPGEVVAMVRLRAVMLMLFVALLAAPARADDEVWQ